MGFLRDNCCVFQHEIRIRVGHLIFKLLVDTAEWMSLELREAASICYLTCDGHSEVE